MDNTDDIWSLAPAKDCVFFVFFKKTILIEIDRYVVDFDIRAQYYAHHPKRPSIEYTSSLALNVVSTYINLTIEKKEKS